jgi:hypothetical protein
MEWNSREEEEREKARRLYISAKLYWMVDEVEHR